MKVTFINPDIVEFFNEPYAPVTLGYLAAMLEPLEIQVNILDLKIEKYWRYKLSTLNPDYIGITATSYTFGKVLEIIKACKKICKAKIIIGGAHPTLFQESLFRFADIDYVVFGEGEYTIRELFQRIKHGQSFRGVNGLIYRHKGSVVKNLPRTFENNIDSIPFPSWHLINLRKYSFIPLVTSRGCPYSCVFCVTGKLQGKRWRARSAENILNELEYLHRKFAVRYFMLRADNFFVSKERVFDICEGIMKKRLDICWSVASGRLDLVDKSMLEAMKRSGCESVSFGIESGSDEILENIKKGFTVKRIERSVELAIGAGLIVYGSFMIGNPGETPETAQKTIEFMKKLFSCGLSPRYSTLCTPTPFSGTELEAWVKENGTFLVNEVIKYPLVNVTNDLRPVFETPQFSKRQRIKAMQHAQRELSKCLLTYKENQLKTLLKTKSNFAYWINKINGIKSPKDLLKVFWRTLLFGKRLCLDCIDLTKEKGKLAVKNILTFHTTNS
ncbi:B12-binding domain-containing radical SAM protein [Candidatus Omnitrophota bacterium]